MELCKIFHTSEDFENTEGETLYAELADGRVYVDGPRKFSTSHDVGNVWHRATSEEIDAMVTRGVFIGTYALPRKMRN